MSRLILFLAATPNDKLRIRADKEASKIHKVLNLAIRQGLYVFETRWAVGQAEFAAYLQELKPKVVHFSGHGGGEKGLVFEDENGLSAYLRSDSSIRSIDVKEAESVISSSFEKIFQLLEGHIECVVLNACYSEVQVKKISEFVPTVIGMNAAVPDSTAIAFSEAFYRYLGNGESPRSAFEWAMVEIDLSGVKSNEMPICLFRDSPTSFQANEAIVPCVVNETQGTKNLDHKSTQRPKRSALVASIIATFLVVSCITAWSWWLPNDHNTIAGMEFLEQGEYHKAREQCLLSPISKFRYECLEVTSLILNDIKAPESDIKHRKAFFKKAELQGSPYAIMLIGDTRLGDYNGNNPKTLKQAEEFYSKALQLNPSLSRVYYGRGLIRHLQIRIDDAIAEYSQAIHMAPDNSRFRLNLGIAYADAERYLEAEHTLRSLLATGAEVLQAHIELIDVLREQGKIAEAKKAATKLKKLVIHHGEDVICEPINTVEWIVLQHNKPVFFSSWLQKGSESWKQKANYINYMTGSVDVPPAEFPEANCN